MKKIVLFFSIFLTALFAEEAMEVFKADDEVINTTCVPQCRQVKEGYVALVTAFDPQNGITYCSIFPKTDLTQSLGVNANTKNKQCIKETNQVVDIKSLSSRSANFDGIAKFTQSTQEFTLSRFLSSLVTLDPALIDFDKTDNSGLLTLKDPTAIYGTNTTEVKNNEEILATADSFNKANLAFYGKLYYNISSVYTALQYGLLVIIGGYFFGAMVVRNLFNQIEKRQSKENVLQILFIPVITFATFFMPIPENNNINATPIQKIMRAGAYYSNQVADKVGSKGAEIYMQKLYSSVGAFTVEGEKIFRENKLNYKNIIASYERGYKECKDRYPNIASFLNPSDDTDKFNLYKKNEKYAFAGCQYIEYKLKSYYNLQRQNDILLQAVEKNIKNHELTTTLKQINETIDRRQNDLGWVSSTIIAGMAVLIENISVISDNSIANQLMQENKNQIEKSSEDRAKRYQAERNGGGVSGWFGDVKDDVDVFLGEAGGMFLGNLTYLMLPGAGDVFNILKPSDKKGDSALEKLFDMIPLNKFNIAIKIKNFLGKIAKGAQTILAIIVVGTLYTAILSYIPLTVAIVAGSLAFIGYIIELAKYFYIMPFVTAFSLTAGRTRKIVDFLVLGICLLFKPVLIVIFIYFALFVYGLFNDIFMIYAIEQMTSFKELQSQVWLTAVLYIFAALLKIVGAVGACYMLWRIIMQAPSWVFKIIGVNDHNASFATEQLGQRLERYSFQL